MTSAQIQQVEIPADRTGPLPDFPGDPSDGRLLQEHLEEHGYALLRGALDLAEITAARAEVFGRLAEMGEVAEPPLEAIATGASHRPDPAVDHGEFWTSVSEGPALRQLTHGPRISHIMDAVLGEDSRAFDLIYLRPTPIGTATGMHYDYPFFAGSGQPMFNAWVPIGDVPVEDGPLVLVEHSNTFRDLIDPFLAVDYVADRSNDTVQQAAYGGAGQSDPLQLVTDRDTRLLTTDFCAGDLLIVSMFTMHGSLDNVSPLNRIRLSCDVRFQPASQPYDDDRYFGANPRGSKGGGYGDMRGAQPLA